ncbi:MAG: hypothetical protein NVS9B2_23830 [Steroidobacteraceae bacterium]
MNELLLWMSARGFGSMRSFRAKVEESAKPVSKVAPHLLAQWSLAKLGHAEFGENADCGGWRVTPPVLATSSVAGTCRAVLCGARTDEVLDCVMDAFRPLGISSAPQHDGPDVVAVAASAAEISAAAAAAGIPVQWNAPLGVLSAFPPVRSVRLAEQRLPVGPAWIVSRFSGRERRWVEFDAEKITVPATGLFRFRADHETRYLLKEKGRTFACEPAMGRYRYLGRRGRVTAYDPARAEFSAVMSCRPPLLVERALVLASGRLPETRNSALVYGGVDRILASAAGAALCQKLREKLE